MPECAFHPGVETEVRCTECLRYICPKDMVASPVGYKCPVCAKPARSQYVTVKPKQLAGGIGMGLLAGVLGGFLLGLFGWTFIFVSFAWGALVGEAVRRGSGGHRGPVMTTVAAVCVVVGGLLGGMGWLGIGAAVLGVVATLGWGWT